jgi:outer membrane immunogenic protein
MKKLLVSAIVALGLIGTPAFAADMPVKAPPTPPPAPVYNWTGFYGGLNMGVSFGRASADVNYFAPTDSRFPPVSTVCGPAGNALCISGSDTVDMSGPLGGVQIGYNWQNGNYLAGLEADFQGTGQSGTRDLTAGFNNGVTGPGGVTTGTAAISIRERMPWLGTVRGRIGYVANPWLLYATGGLAYGRIEVDSSASAGAVLLPIGIGGSPTCNGPAVTVAPTCPLWNVNNGVTKIGWTVGAGAEWALGGNWTAMAEYLFVDLGSFSTTFTGLGGCFGPAPACAGEGAGTGTIHSRITDNIVRLGLNYQFH